MSDEKTETPGTVIEERELWSVQVREDPTYPWVEIGTHRSDAAEILRVYDYRCEHYPDTQNRITKTHVTIQVEDPELLREALQKDPAQEGAADLQSK
jgi:hypothetical protein